MIRILLWGGSLLSANALAAEAHATLAVWGPSEEDEAYMKQMVGRVGELMSQERYDEAIALLDEAEQKISNPLLIYVRGAIEEQRGDCERALQLYTQYLESDLPAADAGFARQGQQRCRKQIDERPIETPSPEAEPEGKSPPKREPPDVKPVVVARDQPPKPSPWLTDALGGACTIGGIAGIGVGIGLYVQSRSEQRMTTDSTSLQSFSDRYRRAVVLNRVGISMMAVGSALVLGGVIRYALVARRQRLRMVVTPLGGRRGGGVTASIRF